VKKNLLCVTVLLTLATAGALADEMTVAPSAFVTAPVTSLPWTGVYVGANGGYGWANSSVSYTANDTAAQQGTCGGVGHGTCIPLAGFTERGALAGGQLGFNWQINSHWLTGVEADYQWADIAGAGTSAFHLGNVGTTSMFANETIKSFGTVRARMGVIIANPLLLYGTGGLAFGRVGETFSSTSAGSGSVSSGGFSYVCTAGGPACFAGTSSKTMLGWTAGAGAEYAITSHLTLKTEILYVDLGAPSGTVVAQSPAARTTASSFMASFSPGFALARGGLNFRF